MSDISGYDPSLLVHRNKHGGIVHDKVRGGVVRRYRDSGEARLFQSFTGQQEGAYLQIATAYEIRVAGLGAKISKYGEFVPATGGGDLEHGAETLQRFDQWHKACRGKYLSPHMALDIIVFGEPLRAVDAKHKFATGTAKKNLLKCLDVWYEV